MKLGSRKCGTTTARGARGSLATIASRIRRCYVAWDEHTINKTVAFKGAIETQRSVTRRPSSSKPPAPALRWTNQRTFKANTTKLYDDHKASILPGAE